ncbi:MAG: imidazoleglycerol-phosphate dehydratase HisB [Ruminococcaceae bacterium]|nr:imidazoleglycerol-phosphate dehydratase HisB [Oscillospiraceae bacterium]
MRSSTIIRTTAETDIKLALCLDGTGKSEVATGVGFLDHMLTLFAKHGRFDLSVTCKGDTYVDDHHSVEDIGIALGQAFAEALGDKRGICRYGSMLLPMDEALILCAVDLSGRACLVNTVTLPCQKVGSFDTELVQEFMLGFTRKAELSLHFQMLAGENTHHIIEAMFKAMGRALGAAVRIEEAYRDEIPSTKGVL